MNYTQNQKIEQVTESTLVLGVDIGSSEHYVRAFDYRKEFKVPQTLRNQFDECIHYWKIYHLSTWQDQLHRQDFPEEEVLGFWYFVCSKE